ncbi:MAG: hypothetical protein OQK69_03760 [Gammaproteobacteria bacterium]|nr:hypothetical protein [Gammaproteobacteria bacterium]
MRLFPKSYLPIVLILFVIGGCSTAPNNINNNYSFNEHPNEGLISYSTRWKFNCERNSPLISEHSYFSYKNESAEHRIVLHNPFLSSDFDNPPGNVHINTATAGKYSIDMIKLTNGSTNYNLKLKKPISFNVERGKINYLGEMSVEVSSCGERFIGDISIPDAKLGINIANKWDRDRKMLEKDYKKVLDSEVKISLMMQ